MPLRAQVLGHFGLLDRPKPGGVAAVALPFSALPPASTPPPSAAAAAILSTLTTVVAHFLSAFPPLERGDLGVKIRVGLETERNWQLRAARRPTIGRILRSSVKERPLQPAAFFPPFFSFAVSSVASSSGAGTWMSLRLLWKMGTGSALLFTIDLSAGRARRARALACPRLPGLGGGAGPGRGPPPPHTPFYHDPLQSFPAFPFS